MGKLRGDLDLAEKTLGAECSREIRPEYLEGDLAVMFDIIGKVDGRHSAAAKLTAKCVSVRQKRSELFEIGGQDQFPRMRHVIEEG